MQYLEAVAIAVLYRKYTYVCSQNNNSHLPTKQHKRAALSAERDGE